MYTKYKNTKLISWYGYYFFGTVQYREKACISSCIVQMSISEILDLQILDIIL